MFHRWARAEVAVPLAISRQPAARTQFPVAAYPLFPIFEAPQNNPTTTSSTDAIPRGSIPTIPSSSAVIPSSSSTVKRIASTTPTSACGNSVTTRTTAFTSSSSNTASALGSGMSYRESSTAAAVAQAAAATTIKQDYSDYNDHKDDDYKEGKREKKSSAGGKKHHQHSHHHKQQGYHVTSNRWRRNLYRVAPNLAMCVLLLVVLGSIIHQLVVVTTLYSDEYASLGDFSRGERRRRYIKRSYNRKRQSGVGVKLEDIWADKEGDGGEEAEGEDSPWDTRKRYRIFSEREEAWAGAAEADAGAALDLPNLQARRLRNRGLFRSRWEQKGSKKSPGDADGAGEGQRKDQEGNDNKYNYYHHHHHHHDHDYPLYDLADPRAQLRMCSSSSSSSRESPSATFLKGWILHGDSGGANGRAQGEAGQGSENAGDAGRVGESGARSVGGTRGKAQVVEMTVFEAELVHVPPAFALNAAVVEGEEGREQGEQKQAEQEQQKEKQQEQQEKPEPDLIFGEVHLKSTAFHQRQQQQLQQQMEKTRQEQQEKGGKVGSSTWQLGQGEPPSSTVPVIRILAFLEDQESRSTASRRTTLSAFYTPQQPLFSCRLWPSHDPIAQADPPIVERMVRDGGSTAWYVVLLCPLSVPPEHVLMRAGEMQVQLVPAQEGRAFSLQMDPILLCGTEPLPPPPGIADAESAAATDAGGGAKAGAGVAAIAAVAAGRRRGRGIGGRMGRGEGERRGGGGGGGGRDREGSGEGGSRKEEGLAVCVRPFYSHGLFSTKTSFPEASIREWLDVHTLLGVHRFYLYDRFGSAARPLLRPWIRQGLVVHVAFPYWSSVFVNPPARAQAHVPDSPPYPELYDQVIAFQHCLMLARRNRDRWIAALDLDEFLSYPHTQPHLLPSVISKLEGSSQSTEAPHPFQSAQEPELFSSTIRPQLLASGIKQRGISTEGGGGRRAAGGADGGEAWCIVVGRVEMFKAGQGDPLTDELNIAEGGGRGNGGGGDGWGNGEEGVDRRGGSVGSQVLRCQVRLFLGTSQ
ncbi:hypothetical protein CLOP_g9258 [Closterium sp. NIES-67]|nr:hypothetical protein CLOP_g9258 [Closterium sp. NIES-67]